MLLNGEERKTEQQGRNVLSYTFHLRQEHLYSKMLHKGTTKL